MSDLLDPKPPWLQPGYRYSRTADGCWGCAEQRIGGHLTFLGRCDWFVRKGQEPKPIPPTVVDAGCRYWTAKETRG